MKTIDKISLALLLIGSLSGVSAQAQRILIDDADLKVRLTSSLDCKGPANLDIETTRPELYENKPARLQAIADSVRAVLLYECPELSAIKMTGLIRGLREVIYQGSVSRQNDWLLESPETTAISTAQQDRQGKLTQPLKVTGIQLGETPERVSSILREEFTSEPAYDPARGRMTLYTGGCPEGFDASYPVYGARAGWKCLVASFGDGRAAQLKKLELVQVVGGDRMRVRKLLVDRYGMPSESGHEQVGGADYLLWRGADRQSLKARLSEDEGGLVIARLTLVQGDDIGLKL